MSDVPIVDDVTKRAAMEAVLQRCGLEFEALGTPPTTALQTINQRTICEP